MCVCSLSLALSLYIYICTYTYVSTLSARSVRVFSSVYVCNVSSVRYVCVCACARADGHILLLHGEMDRERALSTTEF
jgi:hypothetical protein